MFSPPPSGLFDIWIKIHRCCGGGGHRDSLGRYSSVIGVVIVGIVVVGEGGRFAIVYSYHGSSHMHHFFRGGSIGDFGCDFGEFFVGSESLFWRRRRR